MKLKYIDFNQPSKLFLCNYHSGSRGTPRSALSGPPMGLASVGLPHKKVRLWSSYVSLDSGRPGSGLKVGFPFFRQNQSDRSRSKRKGKREKGEERREKYIHIY